MEIVVAVAALLNTLVTGLLFGFVVVAMPGLATLDDRTFLRGFQVMDRVIQNRQPLFMVVWLGSVLAMLALAVLAVVELDGADRGIGLAAAGIHLFGLQLITARGNIPLNDTVQALELDEMSSDALASARAEFEPNWNRWNAVRTVLGVVSTVLLLVLLARL